jgi:hypothetical protein
MSDVVEVNPHWVNAPNVQHFITLNDVGWRPLDIPGVDWESQPAGCYCGTLVDGKLTELEMVAG